MALNDKEGKRMEEIYIGTKVIAAEPMDEETFRQATGMRFRGEKGPIENARDGYKVRYEDGYVSWSPKETFERAYRMATVNEKRMFMEIGTTLERPEHIRNVYKPGEEPQDMGSDN